jgi:hypothetical protein
VPDIPVPEPPAVSVTDADYTDTPLPSAGGPGHRHHEGAAFKRGFTRRERWLAGLTLLLSLIMSGGALLSGQLQQNSFEHTISVNHAHNLSVQAAQARAEQARLCAALLPLAALKAPAGSSASNPSRAFEQKQQAILAKVAPAAGCRP